MASIKKVRVIFGNGRSYRVLEFAVEEYRQIRNFATAVMACPFIEILEDQDSYIICRHSI